MGVDIGGGADLSVAQAFRDGNAVHTVKYNILAIVCPYGITTTQKAGTTEKSRVPAFLVTNVLKVHCSKPNYNGLNCTQDSGQ